MLSPLFCLSVQAPLLYYVSPPPGLSIYLSLASAVFLPILSFCISLYSLPLFPYSLPLSFSLLSPCLSPYSLPLFFPTPSLCIFPYSLPVFFPTLSPSLFPYSLSPSVFSQHSSSLFLPTLTLSFSLLVFFLLSLSLSLFVYVWVVGFFHLSLSSVRTQNAFLTLKTNSWNGNKPYQFVDEHSKGEAVDFLGVLLLAVVLHYFRRHEAFSSAKSLGPGREGRPADSVVSQLREDRRIVDVFVGEWSWHLPDQNVFRFEISVDDVLLVEVLQCSRNLVSML